MGLKLLHVFRLTKHGQQDDADIQKWTEYPQEAITQCKGHHDMGTSRQLNIICPGNKSGREYHEKQKNEQVKKRSIPLHRCAG